MKKIWYSIFISILLLMLGVMMGVFFHQKQNVKNSNEKTDIELSQESQLLGSMKPVQNTVETSTQQVKISPNSILIEKQYFKKCGHWKETKKEIPQNFVNQTKEIIQETYPDWQIEEFTNHQIILLQEKEEYCQEHYRLRENGDKIAIYHLNENGTEIWLKDTEIQTQYLPQEDITKLKMGIEAIGEKELHSILEDFE